LSPGGVLNSDGGCGGFDDGCRESEEGRIDGRVFSVLRVWFFVLGLGFNYT